LMDKARRLPAMIEGQTLRRDLQSMPVFDMSPIAEVSDLRITERLFQIYSHLANAFVWCDQGDPASFVPEAVAVPLVQLAHMVERPPIVPYASTGLANFERIDPNGPHELENLRCIQKLVAIEDESWFHLVHVEIEAHAGAAIFALIEAARLAKLSDVAGVEAELAKVPSVFDKMIRSFRRITERCDTNAYYHTLRPYLFGFDGIIYEGVAEFDGKPMTFRGESGAQSTVIPAIKALIGLQHSHGGLSEDLEDMKSYMPKPHRALLARIDPTVIRTFVERSDNPNLREVYNLCLERMADFRSLHLKMAHAFIAQKVKDPRGTGGTDFMKWLTQLRDETAQQMITA
jgi:indoleamine 2,3-dioxygenase